MPSPIKKAFYDAPDGQLFYRYILTSAGEKKAPVVFLHQSASCGWCYQTMMLDYAARGHDCYAPDMPGFGGSYDPETDPTSTTYYVDVFMGLFRHLKLPKFHLIGHHAGSSMAMELASVYPDEVFTCCLSAPAMATAEEQAKMFKALANEWSKPKPDGSHLMAVWNLMNGVLWTDLDIKNHEVIDTLRAWKGRDQAYACTFKQDKLTLYKSIPKSVPLLAMCSKDDVLWPCFHYCKELQPEARFEVTGPGNFINATHEQVGSIAYFHFDFLEKMGA